jgi:plasmid stabilization system protein ParE
VGRLGGPSTLTLQKGPRERGNSFLDPSRAWADQWAFLASVRKTRRAQVERIVEEAERRGRILGARLVPGTRPVIPYRLRGDRLEVIAVFHGRQKWPKSL